MPEAYPPAPFDEFLFADRSSEPDTAPIPVAPVPVAPVPVAPVLVASPSAGPGAGGPQPLRRPRGNRSAPAAGGPSTAGGHLLDGGADAGHHDGHHDGRDDTSAARPLPASPLNRRNLLLSGVAATVAASGTGVMLVRGTHGGGAPAAAKAAARSTSNALAGGPSVSTPATATSTKKPFALAKNLDPMLLLSRASYGRTASSAKEMDRLGATAWLNRQLAPAKISDPGGDDVADLYPKLKWSPAQAWAGMKEGAWDLMQQTVASHLGHATFSNRQLYEVMVDLWSNHLNITCPSGDVWDTRHRYQIDVIRKYALGSFEDLLLASAFHPSMLVYLNGAQSTPAAPNENYSREVLELHTVGVNGGYTERDVQRGAKLLTGWTIQQGKAIFVPANHYVGSVRVMNHTNPNHTASGGKSAQKAYLRWLAHHPKTATMIATKLAKRFVSDDPSPALVKKLAASYTKHKTEIVPVLRDLFSSGEFTESAGEKIRRPMESLAATARVIGVKLGTNPQGLMDFAGMLNDMGHAPLGWAMPNGYADDAADWQSPASALAQFNATATIVQGWWPTTLDLPTAKGLVTSPGHSRSAVIEAVGRKMLGRKPTATETAAARKLLSGTKLPTSFGSGSYEQQQTTALTTTLFLSSPAHQYR